MITEHPVAKGTWWVTDPLAPGGKACIRQSTAGLSEGKWFVWFVPAAGRLEATWEPTYFDALVRAQQFLDEVKHERATPQLSRGDDQPVSAHGA